MPRIAPCGSRVHPRLCGADAHAIGLVGRVVTTADLDDTVADLDATVAANAPLTIRAAQAPRSVPPRRAGPIGPSGRSGALGEELGL